MFSVEPETAERLAQDLAFLHTSFPHADGYIIERLAKGMSRRRRHIAYRRASPYKPSEDYEDDSEVDLSPFQPGEVYIDPASDASSSFDGIIRSDTGSIRSTAQPAGPWFPPMPKILQPGRAVECSLCHAHVSFRTGKEQRDWK
jgi:hypothetical protein